MASIQSFQPVARSVLRIVVGFTFTCHGLQKLFGLFGGAGGSGAPASLFSLPWAAGLIETIGGTLIFLGLLTAPAAFILSGEMAVAYFEVHYPRGFWTIKNGGELAVVYSFIYLYLFTAGPGPISADAILRKSK
jgi:putative oxidoreductase